MIAEKQVEELLKTLLPKTSFANHVFAVGGFVRDEALGIPSKDLDLVVDIEGGAQSFAEFLSNSFEQVSNPHQLGASYPIWQVTFKDNIDGFLTKGAVIEIADTQKESFPDENSRQRVTEFGTLEEDTKRRDFTVNMLIKNMTDGCVIDIAGCSLEHIAKGILTGHPDVDFEEILAQDPLRMLRLVRFQAKHDWKVNLKTMEVVAKNAHRIEIVSAERIRDELIKIMELGKLHVAINFMDITGLLPLILPEITAMKGVNQTDARGWHLEGDVFVHTLSVLKHAKKGVIHQLAALLHDVAKPKMKTEIDGKIQFLGHDKEGRKMAEDIMRRLKFPLEVIESVKILVGAHMQAHRLSDGGLKAFRKMIRKFGADMVEEILDFSEADSLGQLPVVNNIPKARKIFEKAKELPPVKQKAILGGKQLMDRFELKPGPFLGEIQKMLIAKADELAIEGIELTEEVAFEAAEKFIQEV